VPGLSDYKTNYNNSRYNGKGKGKDSDNRGNKWVVFYDLKIKGYIIEERLNN
jgi:hypothetical protein